MELRDELSQAIYFIDEAPNSFSRGTVLGNTIDRSRIKIAVCVLPAILPQASFCPVSHWI